MVINKGFRTPRLVFTFLDTQHKLLYSLPGQTELNYRKYFFFKIRNLLKFSTLND